MPKAKLGRFDRRRARVPGLKVPTAIDKQCIRQSLVKTAMAVCEIFILMQNSEATSYALLNHRRLLANLWSNYLVLVSAHFC